MAPPDHADSDSHERCSHYLAGHNFKDNPRLGQNVDRLSSWLEFLLHPETHDYDREVYGPFESTGGTWVWREQPERMYNYDTGDGEEFESRSVLHEYKYSDFLDPLVAVSTQQVERGDSLLALATFDAATGELFGENDKKSLGKIEGSWWQDLARTYLETTAEILRNAAEAMDHLNQEMSLLAQNFKDSVPGFTDALPELDKDPNR